MLLVLGVLIGCTEASLDLVDRAAGTWSCDTSIGDEEMPLEVTVERDGTYAITFEGERFISGTWERDGDQVDVEVSYDFVPDEAGFPSLPYTYDGVAVDADEITVAEPDKPRSGAFAVDVQGFDHVVLHQTEWGDGEPTPDEWAMDLDCRKA